MAKSRLSGGYFGNEVDTKGEIDGSSSSKRIDTEISVSEGSSIPPRKCISLNSNYAFGVPMQALPVSNLSPLQRKDLAQRLRSELEQVRLLQKKVELGRTSAVPLPSYSDIRSRSNGNNQYSGSRIQDLEKSLGKKPRGWNRGFSGKFEAAPVRNCSPGTVNTLLMKDCESLLKRLMTHKYGWVFNSPVDVVKLNLPDYFSIIKHPIDLGTIKGKVAAGSYAGPLQFAADVRLTFSNAMTYNPPGNDVHIMADTLSKFFELRWKVVEKKLPRANKAPPLTVKPDSRDDVERNGLMLPSKKRKLESLQPKVEVVPPAKLVMSDKEKHKLGIELQSLMEMEDMPVHIVDFLKEHSSSGGDCEDDEIEVDIDVLSDGTLFKLQKLLEDYKQDKQKKEAKVEACEIELLNHSGPTNSSLQAFGGNDPADEEEVDIGGDEPPVSSYPPVEIEKDNPHEKNPQLSPGSSSDTDSSSSSDSDSDDDKASPGNVSKLPENLGSKAQSFENTRDGVMLERNKSVSGLDRLEDSSQKKPSSCESDFHRDGDCGMTENRQVPPDKLYRAALLKNRFADTILKAREKTLTQGMNSDPENLCCWDREKLELERQKEKERLQAEAKAAEDARKKVKAEAANRKREHEREVARQALLQVEKTVDIDESSKFFKDLEMLRAEPDELLVPSSVDETSPDHSQDGLGNIKLKSGNLLEQLGLYIKDVGDEEEGDPILHNPVNDIEDGGVD